MFPLAERMKLVADSITLAVSAKAGAMKKAGIDVVGFGAGEPDFDTPAFIKDAAKAALDKGQTKYTPTPSIVELKQAIAEKFNRENNLPYKAEQVTVGAGGKHCLYMAFMAILNPGDEVIIPAPFWVSYPEQVKLAEGRPKIVHGKESDGFKITPQQLEAAITPKTKVFMINSPSNPAGHAYTPEELKALADVVAAHPDVLVFSDEIYEKLVYDGLLVDFCRDHGATVIVRGLRALADFEYEFQFAHMNRRLAPGVESVFLMTDERNHYVSSSLVKEVASLGGDVTGLVPAAVLTALSAKYKK
jgi:pantetheine-phosphate adenylyltransferase